MTQRLPSPYRPESLVITDRLKCLIGKLDWAGVSVAAKPWVRAVRDNPPPFWAMETLLKEYPLASDEGLALMRLAEALLRVPDIETAIALTSDQLGKANFDGSDPEASALGRLSSAAISMSKHFLPDGGKNGSAQNGLLSKLGAKTIVAATLRAVQLLGKQFVLGQTIQEALGVADDSRRTNKQLRYSFDMLGEGARTTQDAQRYFKSYSGAIEKIAANNGAGLPMDKDGISIKLSALHPRYEWSQRERVMNELVPTVWALCEQAAKANINLTIDAEEVDRLEISLEVFDVLLEKVALSYPHWQGFGLALQAYQTRAVELIHVVAQLARNHHVKVMCRLVKGAYWDAEVKRAQEMGLPHYPVFTHKHHTDISYLACAQTMLDASDVLYSQFATHNAGTIAAIEQMALKSGARFELQRLHGMGEGIYREVMKNPLVSVRIYAPVGNHKDLLAYLVRRLLENGANSSFVHQLSDESVGMDQLLSSPLHVTDSSGLPMPSLMFGGQRPNSVGVDLSEESVRIEMNRAFAANAIKPVSLFDPQMCSKVFSKSVNAGLTWRQVSVEQRAAILSSAAVAMQQDLPKLCAVLVKEAFKTWADAVSEVREAIDFLHYYAHEAQTIMQPKVLPGPTGESNHLYLKPRGVWVCISPWNFPLAIFIGQVAAALATGNTVLAKPAEQTPYIASLALDYLHRAGVPIDALQLCHGAGETVGAALVALPNIAGVVFTGSTQVAKIIHRALAASDGPIVPLIAETGGINAMIVDSSALPEQVCDAVLQSAFRSSGQRCSALRLLLVHEAIASNVIHMIEAAAQELVVRADSNSTAADFAIDVGPVIDQEAFNNIASYLAQAGKKSAHLTNATDATDRLIYPQVLELTNVSDVKREIFGPVLHVVRWRGDPMAVVEKINQLGYGLTLGIQSRIDSRAQQMADAAHIGNVYINRNMIGAVVGVQPFGGEGSSGTGPKAGGPHYLYRFCAEQTITVNTAAAGGNATLLAH
jgi:RHH-type transcriptional regulator, proline utilization regulon repressor / proline dehydrogenase / delta 1-pyrroline-5-carboxylate dehydrogenase